MKKYLTNIVHRYRLGKKIHQDSYYNETMVLSKYELTKQPRRTEIINYLVDLVKAENYLEIGVRNPVKNFDKILCSNKYSVDPGIEFVENPVDFKMTSDDFFEKLKSDKLKISKSIKFDIIFIDGLHIADQVSRDINNSLEFIKDDGFIVLHDCNPPSEFHQREQYNFSNSPASVYWNGTTWKAFYKNRHRSDLYSICFDSDWGVAIISKKKYPEFNNIKGQLENEYYEFAQLKQHRESHLNLFSFEQWVEKVNE